MKYAVIAKDSVHHFIADTPEQAVEVGLKMWPQTYEPIMVVEGEHWIDVKTDSRGVRFFSLRRKCESCPGVV